MNSGVRWKRWQFMSTSRPSESHIIADVPLSEQTCPHFPYSQFSQRNPLLVSNHRRFVGQNGLRGDRCDLPEPDFWLARVACQGCECNRLISPTMAGHWESRATAPA